MVTLTINVVSYDEFSDEFMCVFYAHNPETGAEVLTPEISVRSEFIPSLTGEYGEPDEFIGRTFDVPQPK